MCASLLPRLGCALAALAASAASVRADDPDTNTHGEYFFGADPGVGSATPFTIPATEPDAPPAASPLLFTTPATPGEAVVLGVRVRDAAGNWGFTRFHRLFLLQAASTPQIETTWETAFTTPSLAPDAESGTLTIERPSSPPEDPASPPNRLALRPVADGIVGHTVFRQVSDLGGLPPTRLYHALDASPDPATAPYIELTDAHRVSSTATVLDLGNPSPGFHSLHLRVRDARGAFTETVRFLHVTPSTVQTLAGLAYSFADASGKTTPVSVAALPATPGTHNVVLTAPVASTPSQHTLVLHLLDADLDAGRLTSAPLRVSTPYHEWTRTALPKKSASATALLADPDGDQIVNLLEFAFGLDPLSKNTQPPYQIRAHETKAGSKRFQLTYRQREGGSGTPGINYTAQGLRYVVETSTNLKTWRVFNKTSGVSGSHKRSSNGDGTETIELNLSVDEALAQTSKFFVRLTVKLAE